METILRRERLIVCGCLATIAALAWFYLIQTKSAMPGMDVSGMDMSGMNMNMPGMVMVDTQRWGAATLFLLFVMWSVMMVAMMVPSSTPMILAFLTLNRSRSATNRPLAPVGVFLLGYLVVWTAFSAVATVGEWGLHRAAILSNSMAATSPALNGGLLIAAGVFQFTPLKRSCLKGCRSPLTFLMSEWRDGAMGAFVMGLRHGTYCLGCCWILMALLFVAGVMNLFWVAVIALLILAEKVLPKGEILARIAGAALVATGIAFIFKPW